MQFCPFYWFYYLHTLSLFIPGIVLVNKYWDGKKDVKLTLLFPNERLGFWEPHFLFQNLGEMQKVKRAFTALEACKQVEDNMVYHENKLKQSDKIDENERKISTGTIGKYYTKLLIVCELLLFNERLIIFVDCITRCVYPQNSDFFPDKG